MNGRWPAPSAPSLPGGAGAVPAEAELAAVIRLAAACGPLVNIGHGRGPGPMACAEGFARRWRDQGGEIGVVVSWPAVAASWLRPACRLAAGRPDAWVIADDPAGWAGMARRLAATGTWRARRTIAFSWLADPALAARIGDEATEGLRVVRRDGSVLEFPETGRLSRNSADAAVFPAGRP